MEITIRKQELTRRGDYVTTDSTPFTSMREAIDNLASLKSSLKDGEFASLTVNGELTADQIAKSNDALQSCNLVLTTKNNKFYYTSRPSIHGVFDL